MAFCNSAFADRGGVAAKTVFGTAGRHKPSGSGGIKIALVFSVFFVPGIFFPKISFGAKKCLPFFLLNGMNFVPFLGPKKCTRKILVARTG